MRIAGKVVQAAKGSVKIHITPRDIKLGDTKDPGACAAARALVRETGCKQARVHIGRTYLLVDDKWLRYRTSGALRSEIIAFDRGGNFEPGEYQLHPVPPSDRHRIKPRSKSRKVRRRAVMHVVANVRERGANR
jgi:hypothetical protein